MIEAILICTVLALSDGDSGRCTTPDGERHRIRLSGIDAPEVSPFTRCRRQPAIWACTTSPVWGDRATARARQLVDDRNTPCIVVNEDRWRRIVVKCTVEGDDLGRILVSEGLAIADPTYGAEYQQDEAEARRRRVGVWQ